MDPASPGQLAKIRVNEKEQRIPALDGVRGLAILGVMACHFATAGWPNTVTGRVAFRAVDAGWAGVDLFFVLSGFLITGILLDAKAAPHYFRNFYMRRVLRIFPLYYGFLVLIFWGLPFVLPFTPAMGAITTHQGWLWCYGTNLFMGAKGTWFFEKDWLKLGHFWSLAIEEQFYLGWPLVVFLFSRRTLIGVCLGCLAFSLAARILLVGLDAPKICAEIMTPCRFDALAAGALGVLLLRGQQEHLFRRARAAACLLALGIVVIGFSRRTWDATDPVVQTIGYSVMDLFFAALLILCVAPSQPNWLARFFSQPALKWFGAYSYAIYVFHVPLMPLFDKLFPVEELGLRLGSAYFGVVAHAILAAAISSLLAFGSWHLYEKHFLKLKKYFAPKRREAAPAALPLVRAPQAIP
jgi:peptidoglycan/LPS O-acetylase OafA/YrhL